MSSRQERIAGIGTLSSHGKMMKKEEEEGSMPK